MAKEENYHFGHRARMTDKVLINPDSLQEHELLEVLLFSFLPRIDTNVISHKLLKTFGSLSSLFNAKAEDIMAVDGIGKTTASKIVLINQLLKRTKDLEKTFIKPLNCLKNMEDFVKPLFASLVRERFAIILLNVKRIPITTLMYDNDSVNSVSVKVDDIVHAFAIHKPTYVVIAHNHPSGNVSPSENDNLTTAKFYMLCSLHGITLNDHVIVSDEQIYSYKYNGDLDKFIEKYKLEKLIKNSEE